MCVYTETILLRPVSDPAVKAKCGRVITSCIGLTDAGLICVCRQSPRKTRPRNVVVVTDWDEDGGLRPKQGRLLADEFEQSALEWSGSHFTGSQGIIGTKQHPVWV